MLASCFASLLTLELLSVPCVAIQLGALMERVACCPLSADRIAQPSTVLSLVVPLHLLHSAVQVHAHWPLSGVLG